MSKLERWYFFGASAIMAIALLIVYVTRSPWVFVGAVLAQFVVPLIWRQVVCTERFQSWAKI